MACVFMSTSVPTPPAGHNRPVDLLILGGGLAGGLLALALHARRPDLKLRLVEGGNRLGGNHLWSFFDSDIDAADKALVAPLISAGWPAYDVRFPDNERTLSQRYYSIESDRFDAHLRRTLPPGTIRTHAVATQIDPAGATLAGGERIDAHAVIDARGLGAQDAEALECGWQKFVGLHLELEEPHGLTRPVVMDATVAQHDGYRFVYVLPLSPSTVFVEDTYYSDAPRLDAPTLRRRIGQYVDARGWRVSRVLREETGVLPVVTGGSFERLWGADGVAKIGARGGLFHPLTSYSLPDAVRTASAIAAMDDLSRPALHGALLTRAKTHWSNGWYYRLLSAMLFEAAKPAERWRVLDHFYRLDEGLVARFYAGRSTWGDRARILAGRPPVPISRALATLAGRLKGHA